MANPTPPAIDPCDLAFIGAGNMAEAIARGVIRAGLFQPARIAAADPAAARRELFTRELGVQAFETPGPFASTARTLLLAVKPYQLNEALGGIGQVMQESALVISILAGVTTASIESALGACRPWRVVRAMPNTPMLLGKGITAVAPGANATPADILLAKEIFGAAGQSVDVEEPQLDAVTAVSGSGPAYFYFLVEQMIAAGVELGLAPQTARLLASQTCLGAGAMLMASAEAPAELRRKVTTPGGTTHAAITLMESRGMPAVIVDALRAAARRAAEMSAR